jgi:PAS domain-containing protein
MGDISAASSHGAAVREGDVGDAVLLMWRLQDETTRLASLLQHAQRLGRIGGFDENILTGEVTWNSQLFDLFGLPATDPPVALDQLGTHAHPDDSPAISRFLRTVLHHRRPASTTDFRLHRPDGIVRQVRIIAEPVQDTEHLLTYNHANTDDDTCIVAVQIE